MSSAKCPLYGRDSQLNRIDGSRTRCDRRLWTPWSRFNVTGVTSMAVYDILVLKSRSITSHTMTRGITSHNMTRGITSHSMTRGITSHSMTRGITSHSMARGITSHSKTRGITSHIMTRDITSHSMTGASRHIA